MPNALSGSGYTDLTGESRIHEYVMNLNALYKPAPDWSIVPSVRLQIEDADANVSGLQTLGVNAPVAFAAESSSEVLDLRERIDLTYNGLTNWAFYGRADWTEGSGNVNELGGLGPVAGIGVPPVDRQTDNSRWFQKYSAGARWYPSRGLTLDAGGYYKINNYDYTHNVDSTPNDSADRYPAYLTMQNFETLDGNFRLKFGPWKKVTLVSRYEFQYSTIHTTPDAISGLSEVEASTMTSHIIAQDVTWSPWSRLSLQVGVNYVLSETKSPASDFTQSILNAQNNYWSLNFTSGFVVDDKTDLNVSYFYYRPDDYVNNSAFGVPYGAGSEQHAVTAMLVRRLTKTVRVMLRYGYFHNEDELYGGNRNYSSHFVSTGLQWRL